MSTTADARTAAPSLGLLVRALLPFGLGYFLSYLYRATNAVVAPDLIRDVGLTAGELGLLTAAYLLSFALFQLPLGILLDRYGPRRVQAGLVAFGAAGALLFSTGTSAPVLLAARGMIGIAFAGGLMSAFKAVVLWVPEPRRPLANSLVMSIGAIGLLVATAPLEYAVQAIGWRAVFLWLTAVTLVVALLILLAVPERQVPRRETTLAAEVGVLGQIYRDRVFLAIMPLMAVTAGAQIALQTLWVGPWFKDVAGLGRLEVAHQLFLMAAAFFVGILVMGAIADWFVRRGVGTMRVILGVLALFFLVQGALVLGIRGYDAIVWGIFAMTGQVSVLVFPWLSSYFGAALSGRANTAANLPMFLAAFAFQYLIGVVIDRFPPMPGGGYAPEAYQLSFGLVLLVQLLAMLWFIVNWDRISTVEERLRRANESKA